MRLLLDTNVILWLAEQSPRLSNAAQVAIEAAGNTLLFSPVSLWELAIKVSLGRLRIDGGLVSFADDLERRRFAQLPLSSAHTARLAELPFVHRDPFDRMLVAQAQVENLALLTNDPRIAAYDVETIW